MSEHLLPCPFCGVKPCADKGKRWATCEECGVQTNYDNWNTRIPSPSQAGGREEAHRALDAWLDAMIDTATEAFKHGGTRGAYERVQQRDRMALNAFTEAASAYRNEVNVTMRRASEEDLSAIAGAREKELLPE